MTTQFKARTRLGRAYLFFKEHGATVYGHAAQVAYDLARAEKWARDEGIEFEWKDDPDSYRDYSDSEPGVMVFEFCVAVNEDGEVLASLGGVGDASTEYRRVVEAELALEAMREDDEKSDRMSESILYGAHCV